MFKLVELLKSENRNVLIKLCKFINLAFNHRNALIRKKLNIFAAAHSLFCVVIILICIVYILGIYCECIKCDLVFYVVLCMLFNDVLLEVQVNKVCVMLCSVIMIITIL